MRRIIGAAAVVAVALIGTGDASAQSLIDGSDPSQLLDLARGFGSAALETDPAGDPLINGRIEGVAYSIYFYGCTGGAACDTALFYAAWTASGASLEHVNEWNRSALLGRAYVEDDGDYAVDHLVNLARGVSRANLDDTFVEWRAALKQFETHVSETPRTAGK